MINTDGKVETGKSRIEGVIGSLTSATIEANFEPETVQKCCYAVSSRFLVFNGTRVARDKSKTRDSPILKNEDQQIAVLGAY